MRIKSRNMVESMKYFMYNYLINLKIFSPKLFIYSTTENGFKIENKINKNSYIITITESDYPDLCNINITHDSDEEKESGSSFFNIYNVDETFPKNTFTFNFGRLDYNDASRHNAKTDELIGEFITIIGEYHDYRGYSYQVHYKDNSSFNIVTNNNTAFFFLFNDDKSIHALSADIDQVYQIEDPYGENYVHNILDIEEVIDQVEYKEEIYNDHNMWINIMEYMDSKLKVKS